MFSQYNLKGSGNIQEDCDQLYTKRMEGIHLPDLN